jgi:hypothetical protein
MQYRSKFSATRLRRQTLFAAVALLAACGSDGMQENESCPAPMACDIRDDVCQRSVLRTVLCLRGGDGELVTVRVVDEAQLIDEIAHTGESEATDRMAAHGIQQRALALFDLGRSATSQEELGAELLAKYDALYRSDSRSVLVIDRGQPLADDDAVTLLAHELVHALQDAEHRLSISDAQDFDEWLARTAIIEGEATLYEWLFNSWLHHEDPLALDWETFYFDWQREELQQALMDDDVLQLAMVRFPYAFGGALVTRQWIEGGRAGVEALLDSPPHTTREILFGHAPELAAEREQLRLHAVPVVHDASHSRTGTALGSWIAWVFAVRAGQSVGQGMQTAFGLVADVFSYQYDAEHDQVTAAWRVRMRSNEEVSNWPGLNDQAFQSWVDVNEPSEAFLLASDGSLLNEPWQLVWEPLTDNEDGGTGVPEHDAPSARRSGGSPSRTP